MDVAVEKTGRLGRRLKVTVPVAEVEKEVAARLQKMARTARLDGFRPGKVPLKEIRKRFGEKVFREVSPEMIEQGYRQAVADHQLSPAGMPDFKDTTVLPGQDIRFTAEIELYPEFTPAPLDKVKIEKMVAAVRESDIDDMIERLRLRHAEWRVVQRPVRDGDRVRVHLQGSVDAFETDDNGELVLVLGGEGLSGEFGAQLLKASCGDTRKIKLRLPGDYPKTALAGRKIKFKADVRKIEESLLPPVDQDFFDKCGIKEGGLPALRDMLKEGMKHELKSKLDSRFKSKVLDLLIEKNKFEVPQVMVRSEIDRMRKDMAQRLGTEQDTDKLGDELFKEQAVRHVKLGLIMNKIAECNQLDVSEQDFEAKLEQVAAAYEDGDAVRRHYRSDQQARSTMAAMTLEEKVLKWVIDQLRVEEKTGTFNNAMQY